MQHTLNDSKRFCLKGRFDGRVIPHELLSSLLLLLLQLPDIDQPHMHVL